MTAVLKLNEELKGIELYFDTKPEQEVLTNLKSNGFRWSGFKKCWWNKQSEAALEIANSLVSGIIDKHNQEGTKINKVHNTKKKKETFGLWDATQWNDLEISQSIKDQDAKEIAKEIRSHVRKRFPQCKFSVRVPYYGRISFDIKSSPYEKGSVYLDAVLGYCNNLLDAYKHTYSAADPYTDFAGVYNFTGWVEISWEYKQTEITEDIKKDMLVFDSKLAKFEKAEEERKEVEFQEYLKQQELRNIEYKKQQEEEKKQVENIYNSINVKTLDDNEQYFVIESEFANLNKRNTLEQYQEEVNKGDFSIENVKITKEVHFNNEAALTNFSNMLLKDFDFLAETGGSFTEDNRINSMTDFYNMDDEEKKTVNWNLYGVAIYFNNKLQFVVDAQGYNYARYVGLTENATIEKTFEYKQVLIDEELAELKHQADVLEDISTSVIEELNIIDTWKEESWKEYKEAIKDKLNTYNLKLNKRIIQQLEIEELKTYMYKLLQDVDSIQEQFKEADIQQGDKVTLFYISDWGSIVTSRITMDSIENTSYAQYDNAVKLTFKPENKRKLHYQHFYSTLLVYKGWHTLPKTVLYNVEHKNGFVVTSSKYHSCDNKQYDEILNHFKQQGLKPIVNTYKPDF
ncbi:hypothetical protein CHH83_02445 [Bacillus sp. 7586-K]|nr:hypothetical protein CHH83_02445 [Bacillus sp. 7586-K]